MVLMPNRRNRKRKAVVALVFPAVALLRWATEPFIAYTTKK